MHCVEPKIFYTNGIITTAQEARNFCNTIEESIQKPVELHHNDTTSSSQVCSIGIAAALGVAGLACAFFGEKRNGSVMMITSSSLLLVAGLEYSALSNRITTSAYKLAQKAICHLQQDLFARVTLFAHSQGADITERALRYYLSAYKGRIDVVTIGPKVTIPHHLANHVVNYRDGSDKISSIASSLFNSFFGAKTTRVILNATCETNLCHGAVDYGKNLHVKKTFQAAAADTCYCLAYTPPAEGPIYQNPDQLNTTQ